MTSDEKGAVVARRLTIIGRVQGVGFRPFLYRLAHDTGVRGWVRNVAGRVEAHVEGPAESVAAFVAGVTALAPPLARPRLETDVAGEAEGAAEFRILGSGEGSPDQASVPPDHFACDDCLAEMRDAHARRYRYPFINCTQCGPRYTIIDCLPYDRPNTSMAGFPLCPECRAEYENPLDRRFHAQPLACAACGPRLEFRAPRVEPVTGNEPALAACVAALRAGRVVAAKGIGGYHLLCDAASTAAVERLRASKPRPHKPLAVLVPQAGADGLDGVRAVAAPEPVHVAALTDPMRPIVLTPVRSAAPLADGIAPGLGEVGLMLPYSPLHHLLLEAFGGPLVATSANLSGEPVLTDAEAVESRLAQVAEGYLHHDRPIRRPADDAVYRVIRGRPRPIRLGRGGAPLEIELQRPVARPVLAVGAHMKNTIALAWGRRAVVSPHIGELGAPRSQAVFEQVIADLQALYGVRAERVACDAHPDYSASRWARRCGLPVIPVFHHHAHAAALAGEHGLDEALLVFAWDGTGYGADGTLWGGEALLGRPGGWERVGALRPFRLPGGDKAGRQPWRSALALAWETGTDWDAAPGDRTLLRAAWERGLNTPLSSAAGRVFDAAAAWVLGISEASFEGQGPMWLEAAATGVLADTAPVLPVIRDETGLWRCDWAPLVPWLQDAGLPARMRAAGLHAALAGALLDQARAVRHDCGVTRVGLTGGVFQNRLLTELAAERLEADGFEVLLHERVPANDAGISFGQIVEATAAD